MSFMIYCNLIYNYGNNDDTYDTYARLDLDNSERILCQITSDAFIEEFFFPIIDC